MNSPIRKQPTSGGIKLSTGRPFRVGWGITLLVATVCGVVYTTIAVRSYEPHTFLVGDCPYYAASALSLIADGDLKIQNNMSGGEEMHAGQVSIGADGKWRPKHPILMPVTSIPFLQVFDLNGLLIFNVAMLTFLAAQTHRLALLGASGPVAALATGVTCLLTFVVTYAYNYSPDAFAAIPGLLAVIFLLDRLPLRTGIAAGLTFLAKPMHIVLVVMCGIVMAYTQGWRGAVRYSVGVLPSVAAVMLYNWILFGDPLTFSYDRILHLEAGIVTQRVDFNLGLIPDNLAGQFFNAEHGLLFTAPSVLVALAGLLFLWQRQLTTIVPPALTVSYLAFLSTYDPWMTSHYGNRFLFIPVLVSALPLAILLERARMGLITESADTPP